MGLAKRIVKGAMAVLLVATAVMASQGPSLDDSDLAKAHQKAVLSAERRRAIAGFEPPKDSYALSLDLQYIAYEYGEDQALDVLKSLFPGRITTVLYAAPTSGTVTKSKHMREMRFMDVSKGTTVFELEPVEGAPQVMTTLEDIVMGRWFVDDGEWVREGGVVFEYYILAPEPLFPSDALKDAVRTAERRAKLGQLTLPKHEIELGWDLRRIALEYGEDKAAGILMRMFPGQIIVKQLTAPTSGIMTKGEHMQRIRFFDASEQTVVFRVKPEEGGAHVVTPPRYIIIGRWFVEDGTPVAEGDAVVEYYAVATPEEQRQASQGPVGVVVAKRGGSKK